MGGTIAVDTQILWGGSIHVRGNYPNFHNMTTM